MSKKFLFLISIFLICVIVGSINIYPLRKKSLFESKKWKNFNTVLEELKVLSMFFIQSGKLSNGIYCNLKENIIEVDIASSENFMRRARKINFTSEELIKSIKEVIGESDAANVLMAIDKKFGHRESLQILAKFLKSVKGSEYMADLWVSKELIDIIENVKNSKRFESVIETMYIISSRNSDPFILKEHNIRVINYLANNLEEFKKGLEEFRKVAIELKSRKAELAVLVWSIPRPPNTDSFFNALEVTDTFINSIDDLGVFLSFITDKAKQLYQYWGEPESDMSSTNLYRDFLEDGKNGPLWWAKDIMEFETGVNSMIGFYKSVRKVIPADFWIVNITPMFFNNPGEDISLKASIYDEKLRKRIRETDLSVAEVVNSYSQFLITVEAATKFSKFFKGDFRSFINKLSLFLLRRVPEITKKSRKSDKAFKEFVNSWLEDEIGEKI